MVIEKEALGNQWHHGASLGSVFNDVFALCVCFSRKEVVHSFCVVWVSKTVLLFPFDTSKMHQKWRDGRLYSVFGLDHKFFGSICPIIGGLQIGDGAGVGLPYGDKGVTQDGKPEKLGIDVGIWKH